MNFEKYTDRARGFIQSAQSLALREGHQQFAPEHLLKVLLDDPEGLAAGSIVRAVNHVRRCRRLTLCSRGGRKSAVAGLARSISIRLWRASSTLPRKPVKRPAIVSSPSSGCCLPSHLRKTARPGRFWPRPA